MGNVFQMSCVVSSSNRCPWKWHNSLTGAIHHPHILNLQCLIIIHFICIYLKNNSKAVYIVKDNLKKQKTIQQLVYDCKSVLKKWRDDVEQKIVYYRLKADLNWWVFSALLKEGTV